MAYLKCRYVTYYYILLFYLYDYNVVRFEVFTAATVKIPSSTFFIATAVKTSNLTKISVP
jgi:hypothetical protein